MGQLVVKLKELRDKLELSHDKSKHVSSQGGRSEQKSLQIQDRSKSRSRDYGATAEIEAAPEEVWTKKFEMMERILENQRKFLEDHNIKIQEIENLLVDLPVGSTHVGENEVRQRDLRKMFQRHEETLRNHTEQLEETCTKIETIREMLDDKKGFQESFLKRKLKEYEAMLRTHCENYEKLKIEIEDRLQLEQKLQDNLLAGFIVGFVIMVMICTLPRSLLASG
ncbi:hypothetical protein P5673_008710 [Acropora cervicornis]|uniref:Uncharacterized protein n=1 Tax=Acropora cervicornis TaxID=6130 RepID=A0AAD9QT80_ACRCE|nr:hypothetical protein P5673_008710 [Acropora cervicornis]